MKDDAHLLQWSPRRVFKASLLIAGILAAIYLAYLCLDLLPLLVFAVILATILEKPIHWLSRLHFSKTLSVLILHGALVALLLAATTYLVPHIAEQSQNAAAMLRDKYQELRGKMQQSNTAFLRQFSENLPQEPKSFLQQKNETPTAENISNAWSIFTIALNKLLSAYAILMLSIYWCLEGERHVKAALLLIPSQRRATATEYYEQVHERLGAFVRGQALLCLAIGLMSFVVYGAIGLPNVLLLACIAGVLEVVPFLGTSLGAIPPILIATTLGPWQTAFTVLGWLVVVSIEAYLLAPNIMEKSVGVHPVLTLLGISALFALWGPLGGVLAIPLTAIVQLTFDRFVFPEGPVPKKAMATGRDEAAMLLLRGKELLGDVQSIIAQQKCSKEETELLKILEKDLEAVAANMVAANEETLLGAPT